MSKEWQKAWKLIFTLMQTTNARKYEWDCVYGQQLLSIDSVMDKVDTITSITVAISFVESVQRLVSIFFLLCHSNNILRKKNCSNLNLKTDPIVNKRNDFKLIRIVYLDQFQCESNRFFRVSAWNTLIRLFFVFDTKLELSDVCFSSYSFCCVSSSIN